MPPASIPECKAPHYSWYADEGSLPINRQLTRLVLTPGSATPGGKGGQGRRASLSPYDSAGRRR